MRWKFLIPLWVALVVLTLASWRFRFERVQDLPVWDLEGLRGVVQGLPWLEWVGEGPSTSLRIWSGPGGSHNSGVLPLPGVVAIDALHVVYRLRASGLVPGHLPWEDGRLIVEWHRPGGGAAPEYDYLSSVRFGQQTAHRGVVLVPIESLAVPMLRFEHLGQAGWYEISELRLTPVVERPLWKWGRWVLGAAWFGWWVGVVRLAFASTVWRAAAVAAVWVGCGIVLAVPGPWKTQRPLVMPFAIGNAPASGAPAVHGAAAPVAPIARPQAAENRDGPAKAASELPRPAVARSVPAVGRILTQGSLALRAREWTRQLRPLIHAMVLAAPAFLFAWLLGRSPAWCLALALAVTMEWAQAAFGYGFGWDDLADIAFDAMGVWFGILAWAWCARRWARFRPAGGRVA